MIISVRCSVFFILGSAFRSTLLSGAIFLCGLSVLSSLSKLAAQNIPQAVYRRGQATKLAEIPSQEGTLRVELMVRGLNMPYSAAWIPLRFVQKTFVDRYNQAPSERTGAWLISEQRGGLWVLFQGAVYPLYGLPKNVEKTGDGGYLDLLYSPVLGRIFLSYAKKIDVQHSTIAVVSFSLEYSQQRFRMVGTEEIFEAQPPVRRPFAYGSGLSASQEYLYIALGSGVQPLHAQEAQSDWGSINKIPLRQPLRQGRSSSRESQMTHFSATIEQPSSRLQSQMLSLGHGNIQSLFWDPFQHRLWAVERLRLKTGRVLADELNLVREGRNYNWGKAETLQKRQALQNSPSLNLPRSAERSKTPVSAYFSGRPQEAELVWKQPHGWSSVVVLPPVKRGSQAGIKNLFAAWGGNILIASLQGQSLYRMKILPDRQRESGLRIEEQEYLLNGQFGPLRWVGLGPDGALYLLAHSFNANGSRMLRLSPKGRMFAD